MRQFTKETTLVDDKPVRDFPLLRGAGKHLADPDRDRPADVLKRLGLGLAGGLAAGLAGTFLLTACLARRRGGVAAAAAEVLGARRTAVARHEPDLCFAVHGGGRVDRAVHRLSRAGHRPHRQRRAVAGLEEHPHGVGHRQPDHAGHAAAGHRVRHLGRLFQGKVDDAIQYLYTTITSIPGVLLVAACALMMQVYIDNHAELYDTSAARADLRLFLLCMILGLTGWSGLCLLRAETLKLRELEYVQAARAFGVSHWRIMTRHLLLNVAHLVLITVVLEFSGLVLYEAVLSYLGIGVDPSMNSFGSMIDGARLEMSRDPMIWWNLMTAFVFMLALVLAANLFADAVRDAFDPRTRRYKPSRVAGLARSLRQRRAQSQAGQGDAR